MSFPSRVKAVRADQTLNWCVSSQSHLSAMHSLDFMSTWVDGLNRCISLHQEWEIKDSGYLSDRMSEDWPLLLSRSSRSAGSFDTGGIWLDLLSNTFCFMVREILTYFYACTSCMRWNSSSLSDFPDPRLTKWGRRCPSTEGKWGGTERGKGRFFPVCGTWFPAAALSVG